MISKGIRISDNIDNIVSVKLEQILAGIENPDELTWCLMWLEGIGERIQNLDFNDYCDDINKSEKGKLISWTDLYSLAEKFLDLWDIVIVGSKKRSDFKRYNKESELYNFYEYAIAKIDSSYWEIFSKDHIFIDRLTKKFLAVKILDPNNPDIFF